MRPLVFALLLFADPALAADGVAPLDAEVATWEGKTTRLASKWGRPVVLFYEDRYSTEINRHVKTALRRYGNELHLHGKVAVFAVASVQSFNWWPAVLFARQGVKAASEKAGIPIFLDLTGVLTRAPWKLAATGSSVLVIDPAGGLAFQASGKLDDEAMARMLTTVLGLLGEPT